MGTDSKLRAVKVPPLPSAPSTGFKPPSLFAPDVPPPPTPAAVAAVPVPLPNEPTPAEPLDFGAAAERHPDVAELVEEIANRDVRLAELENDNIELRLAYQRRGDELSETRGLLEDSQARVELLERRLAQAIQAQPAPAPQDSASGQLVEGLTEALDTAEREIEVARSIIGNLEGEVSSKEAKLADLKAEVAALRNILRNVDARAIELAKRRMGG